MSTKELKISTEKQLETLSANCKILIKDLTQTKQKRDELLDELKEAKIEIEALLATLDNSLFFLNAQVKPKIHKINQVITKVESEAGK